MKKYFLLAGVAGFFFTAASMAGSIAPDKQSAVINVHATIQMANELGSLQDIDFGVLSVVSGTTGDLASIDANSSSVTPISSGVVGTSGDPHRGEIYDNSGGTYAVNVTCSNGTGNPLAGDVCDLGNGLGLKNVTYVQNSGAHYFGGTLTAISAVSEEKNINTPGIKVSIAY